MFVVVVQCSSGGGGGGGRCCPTILLFLLFLFNDLVLCSSWRGRAFGRVGIDSRKYGRYY